MSSRRVSVLIATLALGLPAAGCGDDDGDGDGATTAATRGDVTEYVGAVAGAHTELDSEDARRGEYFVAVAVEGPSVVAYACDSVSDSELFSGELEGDTIELESDSGNATLRATLDGDTFSGDLTVGAQTQAFEASVAEGIGGLYTLTSDGTHVNGRSERGNVIEVTYDVESLRYEGTIVPVEGDEVPLEGDYSDVKRKEGIFDEYRQVLLDSGATRGRQTATAKPVGGPSWIDPDIAPAT